MVRSPIVLSEVAAHRFKLMEKYAAYIRRCGYPDVGPKTDFDDYMRCMLITILFVEGVIDLDAFEAHNKHFAWFDQEKFANASGVVRQYNDGVLT